MSVRPIDLIRLSQQLSTSTELGDECLRRCVVSRAYYAALHAVDTTFTKRDPSARVNGESSHAEIIGRAVARGNQVAPGRGNARTIANMVSRLRRFRNAADYRIEDAFDEREYSDVVVRAQKVLDLCAEFNSANIAAESSKPEQAAPVPAAIPEYGGPRPALKRVK